MKRLRAIVIVMSDKGSAGLREDLSGPAIRSMLSETFDVGDTIIIPDDFETIVRTISDQVDTHRFDLVVTSGGTGLGPRDVTPDATRTVLRMELPGFAEAMRMESYKITPQAIISRAVCGVRGESIIINLPGSPKAAVECLGFIIRALPHALEKLQGDTRDCAL